MIKQIHIYDMDGVLVDSSHRYRNKSDGTINLDYWLKNSVPEKIALDSLLPMAEQYRRDLADPETYVVICTSRIEYIHDIHFIRTVLGLPDKLIMRPPGNTEGDAILKRRALSMFCNLIQFRNAVKRFWDDNRKNLDAVRELGIKCFYIESNQGH